MRRKDRLQTAPKKRAERSEQVRPLRNGGPWHSTSTANDLVHRSPPVKGIHTKTGGEEKKCTKSS